MPSAIHLVSSSCLIRASLGDTLLHPPFAIWRIGVQKPSPGDAPSNPAKVADAPKRERENPKIACLSPHAKSQRSSSRPYPEFRDVPFPATSTPSSSSPASEGECAMPAFDFFLQWRVERKGCSRGVRVEGDKHTRSGRRAPAAPTAVALPAAAVCRRCPSPRSRWI